MAEHGEWSRKGAVLGDVTAQKEYEVTRDFIVKGIKSGKLKYPRQVRPRGSHRLGAEISQACAYGSRGGTCARPGEPSRTTVKRPSDIGSIT
jgi:hypothetical protein